MRRRDAGVTGWRQLLALVCLIAFLCLVFGMARVIPAWSILTVSWGMFQVGRYTPFRSAARRFWHPTVSRPDTRP